MRFAVKDHLGESNPMVHSLLAAGHELHPDGPTDLFLIDLDPDLFGYRELIDFYREQGAVVLQYPHGAPASTLQYDCLYEPYPLVNGQLTNGTGEIEYLRAIGLERPAKVMGWQLCRQFPFRGSDDVRRVVFAPTHVNADGTLDDERVQVNRNVFRQLLDCNFELVVRYISEDVQRIGLWEDERVFRWVQGDRDMCTVDIDVADCVVAGAGTFPCLAIARGVPTVMYGQFQAARYGLPNEEPKPLRNLEKYRHIVQYPYDVQDDRPLGKLIKDCARDEAAIAPWREAWIGKPFDPKKFASMVEAWVKELAAQPELV